MQEACADVVGALAEINYQLAYAIIQTMADDRDRYGGSRRYPSSLSAPNVSLPYETWAF